MRPRSRTVSALLVAILLTATAPAMPATAATTATPAVGGKADPTTVTLVTGDKVTVFGADRFTVRPGPGRSGIRFITTRGDGHLRVVPTDVLPLLGAGTIDLRLFDVTTLMNFRYDDRRADLPLIVTGPAGTARSAPAGAAAVRPVPGGRALRLAKKDIGQAWAGLSEGVRAEGTARGGQASKIWLDGVRKPLLTHSVPQIGAPTAWAAGYDGTGVKVAVLDTGVDAGHPDLAGRVVTTANFTDEPDALDRHGHGTHVAATIASTGAAPGGYKGVAPGSALMAGKVCDQNGFCSDSSILAGMQWAAEGGARVVNMSFGNTDTPGPDPLETAVDRLTTEYGTLFVVAAGNDGADDSVSSPGSADSALTVGAVDGSDALAEFSSRGPRAGDSAVKPDITAPGVEITAALSRDAGGPPDMTHVAMSGTSMATPHVAGAAAILAQQHPAWKAADLKATLMGSAKTNPANTPFAQGAGRVDVARAITQTVTSSPASVSFGLQAWPHNDDSPDARTITYRNTDAADVTLTLSLTGGAPAGMFALSATSVTVPAGKTTTVTLTSDTRADAPDTRYGGYVVAKAGDSQVVTPFGVDKESERYDLTVNRLDRAGQPTTGGLLLLIDLATGTPFPFYSQDTSRLRLPKANYIAAALGGTAAETSVVVDASITLDRPTTVTLDARVAKPVSLTPPAADAEAVLSVADVDLNTAPRSHTIEVRQFGPFDGVYIGQSDPAERQPLLTTSFVSQWMKGPVEERPTSPYVYNLAASVADRVPTGFTKRYTDRDLGRLDATYAGQGPTTGFIAMQASIDDRGVHLPAALLPVTLPGKRAEYYTPTFSWRRDLFEGGLYEDAASWQSASPIRSQAGRSTSERINSAVFGPGFGSIGGMFRAQDQLGVYPALYSPAGAWCGMSSTATGRIVVERAGTVIYDQPGLGASLAGLPAEEAPYRIKVDVDRGAPSRLSTHVGVEWTFRSGAPTGTGSTLLPLSAVRFAPPLSDTNTAPAGKRWSVPVSVQQQPGSNAGTVKKLTVDVSYDDGRTWRNAPVLRANGHTVVVLQHPAAAGFVSLRAASTDTAGNTVKETIIRAYEIV
jgi:subtilisin family serine protease